jgi:exonuclease SbcC
MEIDGDEGSRRPPLLRQAARRALRPGRGLDPQRRPERRRAGVCHGGGLDLEVFDEYTGRSRPASTLSGGEGFGSLDPEALDMAMKALIDLQQCGRTVGVISHVEEMKQHIDVAIEVVQGVRGSRISWRA